MLYVNSNNSKHSGNSYPYKLFIDMLNLTYEPPANEQDDILEAIKNPGWMETWAAKKKPFKEGMEKYKQYIYQTRQYKIAIDLLFPDDTYTHNNVLTLELSPRVPGTSFLRLAYNPAKIPFGVVEAALSPLFSHGVGDLYEQGNVTRLDIAVDILGIRPFQVVLDFHKFRFRTYYLESGFPDSVYIGRDTGVNQLYMYDKVKEAVDKGFKVKPLVDYQPPANGHTRVELRHRPSPAPKLGDLFTLKNVFAPVDMIITPPTVKGDSDFIAKRDLAVLKGLRQTLKQFSPAEGKAFTGKLAKHSNSIDLSQLWATFPAALLKVYPHATPQ